MSLDAMKQALEALEFFWDNGYRNIAMKQKAAMNALRAAIEQALEPVAWMHNLIEGNAITHRPADIDRHPERWTALYTAPPCPTCEALARAVMMDQTSHDMAPRQWQGLTNEELWGLWNSHTEQPFPEWFVDFKRAYEVIAEKLKEKNT